MMRPFIPNTLPNPVQFRTISHMGLGVKSSRPRLAIHTHRYCTETNFIHTHPTLQSADKWMPPEPAAIPRCCQSSPGSPATLHPGQGAGNRGRDDPPAPSTTIYSDRTNFLIREGHSFSEIALGNCEYTQYKYLHFELNFGSRKRFCAS